MTKIEWLETAKRLISEGDLLSAKKCLNEVIELLREGGLSHAEEEDRKHFR